MGRCVDLEERTFKFARAVCLLIKEDILRDPEKIKIAKPERAVAGFGH